ncbi:MAG: hypothetical protein CSA62_05920 [Planctomycetota bacterium]|nr:MAG: hypothetical protein CSA62_05920 [Planctomycetota bacterium]
MWTYFFWTALGYFAYRIIVTAIENERITKVAKIEAKLKHELVQRYQDPAAVERILSGKLHDPHAMRYRVENEDAAEPQRFVSMEGAAQELEGGSRKGKSGDGYLLSGLIIFLLGGAFCASAWIVAEDVLFIPGSFLLAIGLGLLTYATSRTEIERVRKGKRLGDQ